MTNAYLENKHDKNIRNFFADEFTSQAQDKKALGVVLTLKQGIKTPEGTWRKLTRSDVEGFTRGLINQMSKVIYGAAYRRFSKRLFCLATLEGQSPDKRLHVNLAISCPDWLSPSKLIETLDTALPSFEWAKGMRRSADVLRDSSDLARWASYIVKERDSILWNASL